MASLKDIRRRISSVKNTQQITKAMKMVAAAKLRRAQQAIAGARPFSEKLEAMTKRIVTEILASQGKKADPSKIHPLLKNPVLAEGEAPRIALVVVSSDRGLCGAYNTTISRFAWAQYKELMESGAQVDLIFVGKKAMEYFRRRGGKGEHLVDFWTGKFSAKKTDAIATELTQKFLEGKYTRIDFAFMQFRSALTQTATLKTMLPLSVEVPAAEIASAKSMAEANGQPAKFIYEPNREDILAEVLPMQIRTLVYRCFADAYASEFGAKMTAMDSATRNANQMISRLTLEANRVRQASITKELMEIIGGAEALNG